MVEAMINIGKNEFLTRQDGWTILKDITLSTHFERTCTVLMRRDGDEILSIKFVN